MIAQVRYMNEVNRSGKKTKPRQVRKLFSKPKLHKLVEDDVASVQWVTASTEQPPLRATTTVYFADGPGILENVKLYDHTTAADLLKVWAVDSCRCFISLIIS